MAGLVELVPVAAFEELVADALDGLPEGFGFSNVVVVVEDEKPGQPNLLGLYEGVPLTHREHYTGTLPDRITLFRHPLCRHAVDLDDLVREIRVTVMHEFGHHVGLDEHRLHELGWA
ncbi:MAG: metallopeptidase family protein [Frankiales bacterium]|nr:metallopeptidase family protein [Frankiales bacterium]